MDWVPLGELAIGERVYSNDGPLHLVERVSHNQPTDVYNIEVDCEHVYQVGDAGILVHNTCIGDLGEAGAKGWLRRNGYTEVRSVQNRSGHGIDIVARHRDGSLTFFEVKTSSLPRVPGLSIAQSSSANFISSRLRTAANGGRWWSKTPQAVRDDAEELFNIIRAGGKYRHYIIEISNATNALLPTGFRIRPW